MNVGGKLAILEHTMEETWTQVVNVFADKAIECAFTFGNQNRELTSNVPPHIHFERTNGTSRFGGPRSGDGSFATMFQSANAYVWGLQAGEDYEKRADLAALGLVVELMGALYCVAPRYPGGESDLEMEYSAETHVLKYGAQFVVSFQFSAPLKWANGAKALSIGGANANLVTRSS